MKSLVSAVAAALLLLSGCAGSQEKPAENRPAAMPAAETSVILVSLDGFGASYLNRGLTPRLDMLAKAGLAASSMRPAFPSLTFPNHYALVTGKTPNDNGIVNNTMRDPAIPGITFSLGNSAAVVDRRWWDMAEPIWVTLEKRGIPTATMFWPGSEADIQGVRPTYWRKFDKNVSSTARVDQVLAWLNLPESRRPRFITLYLQEADDAGHRFGPDAPETLAAVRRTDQAVGYLVDGLRQIGRKADIVVVSDHGMAGVKQIIRLDRIADPADFRLVSGGAIAAIEPTPGHERQLAASLLRPFRDMQCWRKENLPARFAYGSNPRIPPFICLAAVGGLIYDHDPGSYPRGMHGYDPDTSEMASIFIASGPDIRQKREGRISALDVRPYLDKLLGLPAN